MPKGRRERLLEIHGQFKNNIRRAREDIVSMCLIYDDGRPDLALEAANFDEPLKMLDEAWDKFKLERM